MDMLFYWIQLSRTIILFLNKTNDNLLDSNKSTILTPKKIMFKPTYLCIVLYALIK